MKRLFSLATLIALCTLGLMTVRLDAATLTVCTTGCGFTSLQAAIDAAVAGDTILLEEGHTYVGDFTLPVKTGASASLQITIRSGVSASGTVQATSRYPAANIRICPSTFTSEPDQLDSSTYACSAHNPQDMTRIAKIKAASNNAYALRTAATGSGTPVSYYKLQWLEFVANAWGGNSIIGLLNDTMLVTTGTVAMLPHHITLDQIVIRGDPVSGQFRGIQIDANDVTFTNNFLYDIKAMGEGQAIWLNSSIGPALFENNYASGGTEVFFTGGSGTRPNPMGTVTASPTPTTTAFATTSITDLYVGKGVAWWGNQKTISAMTTLGSPHTLTSCSAANPSVCTTSSAHGFVTGDYVNLSGITGASPPLFGDHIITVPGGSTTTFTIPVNVTTGGTGGTATTLRTVITTTTAHNIVSGYQIVISSITGGCTNVSLGVAFTATVISTTKIGIPANCTTAATGGTLRVRAHAEITNIAGATLTVTPALPYAPATGDEIWTSLVPNNITVRKNVFTRPPSYRTAQIIPVPTGSATSTSTTGGTLAAATYGYRVMARVKTAQDTTANSGVATEVTRATTGSTSTVTITWTAVTNATDYLVYGRTPGAETDYFTVLPAACTPTCTFTDTGAAGTAGSVITTASVWQVKNTFEMKVGRNVLIEWNVIENSWQAGQGGPCVLFTGSQQNIDGQSAVIRDTIFRYNMTRHCAQEIQITGRDALGHESARSGNIQILHNLFFDIGQPYGVNNGIIISAGGGPRQNPLRSTFDILINHNTFAATAATAPTNTAILFSNCEDYPSFTTPSNESPSDNTDLTNNIFYKGASFGLASIGNSQANCNSGFNEARIGLAPSGPLGSGSFVSNNVLTNATCSSYATTTTNMFCPTNTTLESNSFSGIISPSQFKIKNTSPYFTAATDSTMIGADWDLINPGVSIAFSGDNSGGSGSGGGGGSSGGSSAGGVLLVGGICRIYGGSGSPETVVTAPVCSMYLRMDGSTNTTLYMKQSGSGNTGWAASSDATALKSATTSVNVVAAAAPSSGQVLTATGSSAANWQTPGSSSTATGLASATTTVAVSAAAAPSSGQRLTATSSTAANWQTPSTTATGLTSATTTVGVSAATAPSTGQVLTATGSTAATWQTPSSGGNGYALNFGNGESGSPPNPADATTYYIGHGANLWTFYGSTEYDIGKIMVPKTGTIHNVTWDIVIGGVNASAGTVAMSLRLNNSTDTTLDSASNWASTTNIHLSASVSIAVTAGDFVAIKIVTPTWTTNPTYVYVRGYIYVD